MRDRVSLRVCGLSKIHPHSFERVDDATSKEVTSQELFLGPRKLGRVRLPQRALFEAAARESNYF